MTLRSTMLKLLVALTTLLLFTGLIPPSAQAQSTLKPTLDLLIAIDNSASMINSDFHMDFAGKHDC